MSALGLSPYSLGSKRFLDDEEGRVPLGELKRHRQAVSPGRCAPSSEAAAASYAVGSATLAALRALFPEMNDKVGGVSWGPPRCKLLPLLPAARG